MLRGAAQGAAAVACAVVLAACGGGADSDETETTRVGLPTALAEDLAAESEAIGTSLDAGDVCKAANQADTLLAAVLEAINGGQVPAAFQEELSATANELVNEINCPPPEDEAEDDDDKGKGNDKDEKDEDKKDEDKKNEDDTKSGETATEEGGN